MKRIYFDTEFTELSKNCDLISIGCVIKENSSLKYFYAEIKNINVSKQSYWIRENVIKNCLFLGKNDYSGIKKHLNEIDNIEYCFGTFTEVRKALKQWIIDNRGNEKVQFVSDVSSYDFVLLVDLLTNHGTALDLPEYIVSDCYNISQTIADTLFNKDLGDAFDVTREQYLTKHDEDEFCLYNIIKNPKHNALWDAYVISKIGDRYGI